mmetsp:Transcript_14243/g.34692  ORF Transcript_14243/g.34692 Transcript_14243/m.34692 type:complete len:211 (-) Transcript_14243:586-1218(-)
MYAQRVVHRVVRDVLWLHLAHKQELLLLVNLLPHCFLVLHQKLVLCVGEVHWCLVHVILVTLVDLVAGNARAEKRHNLLVRVHGSVVHRVRPEGVLLAHLDVRCLHQHPDRLEVAVARSEHQGGKAVLVDHIHLGVLLEQVLQHRLGLWVLVLEPAQLPLDPLYLLPGIPDPLLLLEEVVDEANLGELLVLAHLALDKLWRHIRVEKVHF